MIVSSRLKEIFNAKNITIKECIEVLTNKIY